MSSAIQEIHEDLFMFIQTNDNWFTPRARPSEERWMARWTLVLGIAPKTTPAMLRGLDFER